MAPIIRKEERATIRILSVGKISSKRNHRLYDSQGFTLLEMILVLIFMGLMAGLTTPFVLNTLERIDRQTQVRNLVTTMRFARSQAITVKTRIAFAADIESGQYWVLNLKTGEISKLRKLGQEIKIAKFKDSKDEIDKGKIYIVFYPQGNSSGGHLLMEANDAEKSRDWFEISVDPVTGKPDVTRNEE